jgi:Sulfotransferase family
MSGLNICLIGGTGRSGTTILKEMFAKHPDVASAGEIRITTDPEGVVDFYTSCSQGWSPYLYDAKVKRLRKLLHDAGRNTLLRRLYMYAIARSGLRRAPRVLVPRYAEVRLERHCPGYFRFVDELMERLTDYRYQGRWTGCEFWQDSRLTYKAPLERAELADILGTFLRRVIQGIVTANGGKHFVEDTPWNILWFDKLLELLPEARLVHIYRDPRDVTASFCQQWWAPAEPRQAAQWCKGIIERWWRVRESLPKDTFCEIALERLIGDTDNTVRELCDFWRIPYDRALLTTDLGHGHSGRWRRDLTAAEQTEVSAILRDQLEALGYR